MTLKSNINSLLPQKFFGVIPLYIGIEIILGIAIFNKAGGAYGFLSIVTGHPIDFYQWLYNILCIIVLPFYISSLVNMNKCKLPDNLRKFCLTSVIFLIDTVIGTLYTLYFVYFWFHNEATEKRADVPKVAVESSQSATELRELFVIISTTIAVTALRFYFTLVILSFAKALLRFSNQDVVDEPVFESGYKGNIKRFFYGLEVRSKDGLLRLLR